MRIDESLTGLPLMNTLNIQDLQGGLKDLSKVNYERLRKSLDREGFFVPLYVWLDRTDGTVYTLDGHQRMRFFRTEYPRGIKLPVQFISARDKVHAKERLLIIDSAYGERTKEGFDEFMLDMGDFDDFILDFTTYDDMLDKDITAAAIEPTPSKGHFLKVECLNELELDSLLNELSGRGFGCKIV